MVEDPAVIRAWVAAGFSKRGRISQEAHPYGFRSPSQGMAHLLCSQRPQGPKNVVAFQKIGARVQHNKGFVFKEELI